MSEKIIKMVVGKVSERLGIYPDMVYYGSKRRNIVLARRMSIYICHVILKIPKRRIAGILGISIDTVSRAIKYIIDSEIDQNSNLLIILKKLYYCNGK